MQSARHPRDELRERVSARAEEPAASWWQNDASDWPGGFTPGLNMYGRYARYGGDEVLHDAPTVSALAQSLGVRYEPRVGPDDLTLIRLRSAYQARSLHVDAARILDREIVEATTAAQRVHLITAHVAMDGSLDSGDLASADKIATRWGKDAESQALRALRLPGRSRTGQ